MTLLAYLLKVIVVSAILYGYYRLFLRNKRFHHYNRFFLLSILLLSIVLPFIRITLLYEPENPVHEVMYRTVSVINADYVGGEIQREAMAPVNEPVFTLMNSIYLLYAIGVLFLMTLVIKSLLYIRSLRKRYPSEKITSLRFYNTHEPGTPFSFFRSIFWNDQLQFNSHEGQQIFRHELFHVQHQHSADRLLSELVTAIFWFNPFFHLVKKELKAIHEFLADQFAISDSDRYAYATLLVQQALDPRKHGVTNHFFQNHIKRRIAMITEFQKSKYGYWSRVMVLPLSLLLFCFVTLYAKKPSGRPEKIASGIVDNDPALTDQEITGQDFELKNEQVAITQVSDTIPGKYRKERELELKARQVELEMLRKKMIEQEEEIRRSHQVELEELKKHMMEAELMSREREQNRKLQQDEAMKLKRELLQRQNRMNEIAREEQEKMLKVLKEHEASMRENPAQHKENEAKLERMKKEMEMMQQEFKQRQNAEVELMKSRMEELELHSQQQIDIQKNLQLDIENKKKMILERQAEIKNHRQEELQRLQQELQLHEKEIELKEQQLRKQDEIRREQQQEMRRRNEERRDQQEKKREQKKEQEKEKDKQKNDQHDLSLRNNPGRFITEDSLLKKVIRHYLRNLHYPETAIQNGIEGPVYFSIVVDKNGAFRDFVAYENAPKGKEIKDLVLVSYKKPSVVLEKELSNAEKTEILRKEVERASHFSGKGLVYNPEDRRYYFKAVFRMLKNNEEKDFLIKNTSDWQIRSSKEFDFTYLQDTIPAKRALKARTGKPARISEKRAKMQRLSDNPKPATGAKPGSIEKPEPKALKALKQPSRKAQLGQKKERKILAAKKPARPIGAHKSPTRPAKPKIKPSKDGSGPISDQEENEENYSEIPVNSGK